MKTIIKATAKKTLNNVARRTVAEVMGAKRGRPSNAELAERAAAAAKQAKRDEAKAARAAEKEKAAKAAARAAKKEEKVAPKAEAKRAPKATAAKADTGDFKISAFKKAISRALRVFNKDMTQAMEVLATYKANRKLLKDALPKHAVNAFEKSLAAKKDEKLLEKAIFAAEKHIVEKDFTM